MELEVFNQLFRAYLPRMTRDELFWLVNVAESIDPKRIIEIGVLHGGSLKMWEYILPEDGTLIGVDLYAKPRYKFGKKIEDTWLIGGMSQDPRNVEAVKVILGGRKADFLFIDGYHSFWGAYTDFRLYGQFIRKDGIIALHDLPVLEGFWEHLINETKRKYGNLDNTQTFVREDGIENIGLWRVK